MRQTGEMIGKPGAKFFGRVFNGLRLSIAAAHLTKKAGPMVRRPSDQGTKGPREQGNKGPRVRTAYVESCHGQPEKLSGIIHAEGRGDVDQPVTDGWPVIRPELL